MSLESARAFRQAVSESPELQERVRDILSQKVWNLLALAREYGYDITPDEGDAVFREEIVEGELSDFELEMVSAGGCTTNCVTGPSAPDCGGFDCS
jgi:predicted ribosomally synthesized peptide with nif11-like leader